MLDSQIHYLTRAGYEELDKRLRYLTLVRRDEVAEKLRSATEEGGDLAENLTYIQLKDEQGMLEGEIARLEMILAGAEIIEEAIGSDIVVLGSSVTVIDLETKDEEIFQLVGTAEANPREGRISFQSPAGRVLLGKKVGQKATYKAPMGEVSFRVKAIQ